MGGAEIIALIALGLTVLGSLILTVYKTGALKNTIDEHSKDIEHCNGLNDRVLKLEFQATNTDKRLDDIKEQLHKLNNKMQDVANNVIKFMAKNEAD